MCFYDSPDKRFAVYGMMYKIWSGNINYHQKPEYATSNVDDAIRYIDEHLINDYNDTAYVVVDYMKHCIVIGKVKENDVIRNF